MCSFFYIKGHFHDVFCHGLRPSPSHAVNNLTIYGQECLVSAQINRQIFPPGLSPVTNNNLAMGHGRMLGILLHGTHYLPACTFPGRQGEG